MRAVLGTLASGGLTAAALGGPLAPGAFAGKFAEVPTTPEVTASSEPAAEAVTPAAPTSTSTTPAPTSTTTGTTTTPQPATPAPQEAPAVALQRRQKTTKGVKQSPSATSTAEQKAKNKGKNNVAGSPQSVAKAGALAAVLASSQASVQALAFYRVPLFLLPIYKAAAVQYGVPWQILAAINEIETDYGTDQSVSSAGAVGWMQFMPETWMQYGVDALNSGYADPYNPVDAVFAAARYLRAAGAATNLRQAILAYNHSEEYVDSVMLRAKLISTYPKPVIATLTGLVDGRPPVDGKVLEWGALPSEPAAATASSSTAGATATSPAAAGETAAASAASASTPGSSSAPSPTAAAASHTPSAAPKLQTVELTSSAKASVVAVQDGRVMQIGDSRKIGRYIVLRDVYGDLFTYAGLGSIAPTYTVAKATVTKADSAVVEIASTKDPAPSKAATAGSQTPVTLQVKTPAPQNHGGGGKALIETGEAVPAGMDRKRLFAKPGNPDAKAAAAVAGARREAREKAAQKLPLRKGSVVSSGTVLGTVTTLKGSHAGHLRFGIRPSGDAAYIDPGPVLANWAQLQKALHPQGARAANALLGATASDVFLLSKSQLERTVLSDPGITVTGCSRQDIASGVVDHRVLALLAFLSRSGLKPTVGALRCGQSQYTASGALSPHYRGDAVDISAINDVPLARHQGPGTITDLTIRALLTLPHEFVPHEILSLMHYPASASTRAESSHWNKIELVFAPATKTATPASSAAAAHSAGKGATAPVPVVSTSLLSPVQWTQLIGRVGAIATPKVAYKPTSAAIPDPKGN
jgi:soluble lytic murein transglycosylase-like protein